MVFEKIEKLAKEKGITIKDIERDLKLGNGTIRRWKKSSPSLENIAKVARYLGVTVDYFAENSRNQ